jgi:ribosomal protein S18 acetylase RimI-like enzyme
MDGSDVCTVAQPSDCAFLGAAIVGAERSHTGIGLWDVYINESGVDSNLAADGLSHICLNELNSLYHYSRFRVVRDKVNGDKPVACACGYVMPELSLFDTVQYLGRYMIQIGKWKQDDLPKARSRLDFLHESFAEDIDWMKRKWMIEGVFTDSEYRGKGFGELVLRSAIHDGRDKDCDSCWITCAIGNTAALRLYLRVGFQLIGTEKDNSNCEEAIRTPGFHVLELKY